MVGCFFIDTPLRGLFVLMKSKHRSFGQFMAASLGALLGVAALGAPVPAKAARIYNALPVAIVVCPMKSVIINSTTNNDTRNYSDKAQYPDSNTWTRTANTKSLALDTKRSDDACIGLAAGSEANPVRSESINWTSAVQINVRLAFSPSLTDRRDDRCIYAMESRKYTGLISPTMDRSKHDFQGGNYVVLRPAFQVVGTVSYPGGVKGTLHADGTDIETYSRGGTLLDCANMTGSDVAATTLAQLGRVDKEDSQIV